MARSAGARRAVRFCAQSGHRRRLRSSPQAAPRARWRLAGATHRAPVAWNTGHVPKSRVRRGISGHARCQRPGAKQQQAHLAVHERVGAQGCHSDAYSGKDPAPRHVRVTGAGLRGTGPGVRHPCFGKGRKGAVPVPQGGADSDAGQAIVTPERSRLGQYLQLAAATQPTLVTRVSAGTPAPIPAPTTRCTWAHALPPHATNAALACGHVVRS